jgi:hypothetical protein
MRHCPRARQGGTAFCARGGYEAGGLLLFRTPSAKFTRFLYRLGFSVCTRRARVWHSWKPPRGERKSGRVAGKNTIEGCAEVAGTKEGIAIMLAILHGRFVGNEGGGIFFSCREFLNAIGRAMDKFSVSFMQRHKTQGYPRNNRNLQLAKHRG